MKLETHVKGAAGMGVGHDRYDDLLKAIEAEPIPEKLMELAMELQAVLKDRQAEELSAGDDLGKAQA